MRKLLFYLLTEYGRVYCFLVRYESANISSFCQLKVLGTVGHPVNLTEIKVFDIETGEALPDGSKGIVKIKGPQVMKGYYKVLFPCFTDANHLPNLN